MVRRSPLCETCGDLMLKHRSSKIMAYLVLIVILSATGFLYLFNINNLTRFLLTFIIVIVGAITFGLIGFVIIQKQEAKSD